MESPLPGPTRCDMHFLSLGYHFPNLIGAGILLPQPGGILAAQYNQKVRAAAK
jgi:hypothetical protein